MGHIIETLEMSEHLLCKGIDEINQKGELNASTLEMLGTAVDALKDIQRIRSEMGGSYSRYMDDGYSRGRRRDSLGRYMGSEYDHDYDRMYRDSYGDDREDERRRLEMKMRNSQNEREREMYRQKLEQL
jgi:hypothetical protein